MGGGRYADLSPGGTGREKSCIAISVEEGFAAYAQLHYVLEKNHIACYLLMML